MADPENSSLETDLDDMVEEHDLPEGADIEAVIGALQDELAGTKDRLLRMAAELENTRRRADREKQDASKFGIANFARDMLAIADNLQRALDATPTADTSAETLDSFVSGIKLTEKELMVVLQRHGVIRLAPQGEKFDPNLHQAIAEVPGKGEPAGHVVDVVQPGFTIGERILRPAMVTVSSGAGAKDIADDADSDG